MAPLASQNPVGKHHTILLANVLAQAEALMKVFVDTSLLITIQGKTASEARAELERAGMKGAKLDALVPHKVSFLMNYFYNPRCSLETGLLILFCSQSSRLPSWEH